jgi:hypothetical protein
VSSGLLRRVVLTRATRRNNPEDTILHYSNSFPIQGGLKQGYVLSSLLFNFAYAIRKVRENQVELKLNGTHQLLAYADDVTLLGHNTETLVYASKEVGLKVNVEKTKYMLVSRHQNSVQNRDIKIANRLFQNA